MKIVGNSPIEEKTFVKLGIRYENHIFGDKGAMKVGGHRRGRYSKKDKSKTKAAREFAW